MPQHVMRDGTYAQYAQGHADEVAVYDVALPASTIAQHRKNPGHGPLRPAPRLAHPRR